MLSCLPIDYDNTVFNIYCFSPVFAKKNGIYSNKIIPIPIEKRQLTLTESEKWSFQSFFKPPTGNLPQTEAAQNPKFKT